MPKNYFKAVAVMVGYIIGVGMFGLPFLVSQTGILPFAVFAVIFGPVQYLLHLIYANIILVTKGYHRMPGHAYKYLGHKGKIVVFIAKMIGNYGALLAYIIITGIFLHQLLNPIFGGSEFMYATILFLIEALVIYFGIGIIARAELVMTILLLLVVAIIGWKGWGVLDTSNYSFVHWRYFLLPYGAILFSFDGSGSLPIVAKLLHKNASAMKSVVRVGTILSIVVVIGFTLIIVGMSGALTTPDALVGMSQVIGDGVILLALVFGLLTMITSFFGVAESVRETLSWDFNVNRKLAWVLAVFGPYLLYLFGFKNLIEVISLAGAVAGGLCAIIMIIIFKRLQKMNKLILFKYQPSTALASILITMFISGIFYEIYVFFIK